MSYKVAKEVAEKDFERMCEANRISFDTSELDDEERAEFDEIRGRIVLDICSGRLAVDGDGRPVYTPPNGKSITFHPATGATLMALETHPKGKDVSNLIAAMADMTHTDRSTFSKLAATDFKACCRIANLFLADR